jgi:DNA-directed RNA polymerase sigma subunit (sigma70/sigma32)
MFPFTALCLLFFGVIKKSLLFLGGYPMNDHNNTPCLNADLSENLQKFLFKCTEREVLVLRLKYGLDDGKVKTLGEVAEILGISRERVRQIE